MQRAFKYKILPTQEQNSMLLNYFGSARYTYNVCLEQKIKEYETNKKTKGYNELAHFITELKRQNGMEWLKEVPAVCLQQSLRNLECAFSKFFKEKKGFPNFKSKHKSKKSIKFIDDVHFDFDNWYVKIPKIGYIKLYKNRTFDISKIKQGTVTISQDKCNTYWCTVVVDTNTPLPPKAKVDSKTSVGIDVGIKTFATLSSGTKYDNPKYLEHKQKKLAHLQRCFARTQKDSSRRQKARLKVSKCYRDISNKRNDFTHKLTHELVTKYDTICLENLNIKGMMLNHNLAMHISSVAWNEFVRQLKYKADWYGKNVIFIGRFEPSSKTCSNCGYINKELKLSERRWKCPICGSTLDRDINAAINIKNIALKQ